jgi:transcriptional regulator with XRE-family HTH domain
VTRLKFERTNQQLSQTRVGRVANIPQPTLSLIELGRLAPTPVQLRQLAAIFRVDPAALLKDIAVLGPSR